MLILFWAWEFMYISFDIINLFTVETCSEVGICRDKNWENSRWLKN